ncbi:unnamed protein product [Lasius platythorax]|uniref:Uncharacterized protein n=1 Tax=Lasius platythorax TaxID=488582 RepID=A0AAV2MY52_9HYME
MPPKSQIQSSSHGKSTAPWLRLWWEEGDPSFVVPLDIRRGGKDKCFFQLGQPELTFFSNVARRSMIHKIICSQMILYT